MNTQCALNVCGLWFACCSAHVRLVSVVSCICLCVQACTCCTPSVVTWRRVRASGASGTRPPPLPRALRRRATCRAAVLVRRLARRAARRTCPRSTCRPRCGSVSPGPVRPLPRPPSYSRSTSSRATFATAAAAWRAHSPPSAAVSDASPSASPACFAADETRTRHSDADALHAQCAHAIFSHNERPPCFMCTFASLLFTRYEYCTLVLVLYFPCGRKSYVYSCCYCCTVQYKSYSSLFLLLLFCNSTVLIYGYFRLQCIRFHKYVCIVHQERS